jgi:hypothetical protein
MFPPVVGIRCIGAWSASADLLRENCRLRLLRTRRKGTSVNTGRQATAKSTRAEGCPEPARVATGPANPMAEAAHDRDDFTDRQRADRSDHDQRNQIQLELLRLAAERRRHAQYIDSMLRQAGSSGRGSVPQGEDPADEESGGA